MTFKATKALVQYVSAVTTLSQGIKTFQYADKGGGVVFQFNSPKRGRFFFLKNSSHHSQIEGIFTTSAGDQRKYRVLSFSKQEIVPNLRGSTQSLSEQVCFTLLFSTPKSTLYNLILCLSTQEIIPNLESSI